MDKIIKPATLIREDFINNLIDLTNESNLPLFVVEAILKEFLEGIHAGAQQQAKEDKERYTKQLIEAQKKSEEESR